MTQALTLSKRCEKFDLSNEVHHDLYNFQLILCPLQDTMHYVAGPGPFISLSTNNVEYKRSLCVVSLNVVSSGFLIVRPSFFVAQRVASFFFSCFLTIL